MSMTLADVEEQIKKIKKIKETSFSPQPVWDAKENLYRDVLVAITEDTGGSDEPKELASAALQVEELLSDWVIDTSRLRQAT